MNSCMHEAKTKDGELYPAEDGEEEVEGDRKRSRGSEVQGQPQAAQDQEEGEEAREVRAPPIPEPPSREQVLLH